MPNTYSGGDVLSFTNSYLPTRLYACQKRIRIRRVRWCEGYVIRLLKVSSMSWLVVLLLHKSSMLPDIMQPWLQDTFLRGSARVRPCRLSATLVLNTKTLSQCTRGTDRQSFWDVPLFGEHQEVRANRVDPRIINHESKRVITPEVRFSWVTNREKKEEEKTTRKYAPHRWELKKY